MRSRIARDKFTAEPPPCPTSCQLVACFRDSRLVRQLAFARSNDKLAACRTFSLRFLCVLCVSAVNIFAFAISQTSSAQAPAQQENRGIKLKPGEAKSKQPGKKSSVSGERPELILQTGHSVKVDAMAFSPDGLSIATGGADGTIKIWDAAAVRELRTLAGHAGGVKAVAFNPDGTKLVSGGADGRIVLWDVASGNEAGTAAGHAGAVSAVAFSRDGRRLASGGADFKVKLWDAATLNEARQFEGHYRLILALAFSPDGARLASGGADEVIRLWDLSKSESKKSKKAEPILLEGHTGWVRSLAFSPDSAMLLSGGADAAAPRNRRHALDP